MSAVLARAEIKTGISARDVTDFIDDLAALPIAIDDRSVEHVFSDVHRVAVAYRLTSYDAAYLELALRHGLPLATLEENSLLPVRPPGFRYCSVRPLF